MKKIEKMKHIQLKKTVSKTTGRKRELQLTGTPPPLAPEMPSRFKAFKPQP